MLHVWEYARRYAGEVREGEGTTNLDTATSAAATKSGCQEKWPAGNATGKGTVVVVCRRRRAGDVDAHRPMTKLVRR